MTAAPSSERALFVKFIEALPDAAALLDQETGTILAANAAAVTLYGVSAGNLPSSLSLFSLTTDEQVSRESLSGHGVRRVVRKHKRRDGSVFSVEILRAELRLDGQPLVLGLLRDVSERERSIDELRASRAVLDITFENSPLLMTLSEPDSGRFVQVNKTFERITGYSRAELIGKTSLELGIFSPEERAKLATAVRETGRVEWLELAFCAKDGRTRFATFWAEIIETADGSRLLIAAEDITGRKALEAKSREAEDRLGKIASRLPGVVYSCRLRPDGHLSFPFVGPTMRDVYGVTAEDAMRDVQLAFDRVHPDDLERVREAIMASARELTPYIQNFRLVWPDGSVRWVVANSLPEREPDGAVTWYGFVMDVTERRETDAALRVSQALLDLAFERSPLVMTISDAASGRLLHVNHSFERVLGFSSIEALGKTTVELGAFLPDEREALARAAREKSRVEWLELPVRRKDGKLLRLCFWAETIATPGGDRLIVVAEDVTERRALEDARHQAHERLEKLAASVPGGVFEYRRRPDGSSRFDFANAQLRALYGVTTEDLQQVTRELLRNLSREDQDHFREALASSAIDLKPVTVEHRVLVPGAPPRWVSVTAAPERESDDSVVWRGVALDVTVRKEAAEALRRSDERFALAIDSTSDGLFDINLATDEWYATPNHFRMLGYDPPDEQAQRHWLATVVHPDDRAFFDAHFSALASGQAERSEDEFRAFAKDGSTHWLHVRGRVVSRGPDGRAVRIVGTTTDITERKRFQLGLAQNDRLASMGLLAAGVAHEINNPLAWVIANLEDLEADAPRIDAVLGRALEEVGRLGGHAALARVLGPDAVVVSPERRQELLKAAEGAAEGTRRIRKISRGLGSFARVERVDAGPVDVNSALETAATMAHNELKFRARLEKDLAPVPPVRASEGKLAQVFLNLLINAAHATPEGDVERHCVRLRTRAEGGHVVIEISDTGHGISQEHLSRLFEPFFTTKKVGVGSGLGLSISRRLVEEFGGTIEVDSALGRGTTMRLRFPAAAAAPQVPSPASLPPGPAPRAAPRQPGRARVLVIDDEAPLRKILVRLLGQAHDVVAVESGVRARELLEHDDAFDLVLCDLMMPGLTGMELHAWLAETRPALAERVVFLSGGAFTPNAAEYMAKVKVPLLEKPFDRARLVALVSARAPA